MSSLPKPGIVDFATRSFRDVADRDYIAARVCYRLGLDQQFLWMALQATEKYVKGILLFSSRDTRYGHEVKRAFDALETEIPDIPFSFPENVGKFLAYLQEEGANRYFTRPFSTAGKELLFLDQAVWHLRLYCQNFRQGELVSGGKTVSWFDLNVGALKGQLANPRPNTVELFGGYLEKVVKGKDSAQRRALVWNNPFYGRTTKAMLRNYTFRSSSAYPTPFMHPEVFETLAKPVHFEPSVYAHFKKRPAPHF